VNIVSFPLLPRKRVDSMVAFKAWAIPSEVVKALLNFSFICGTQLKNVATSAHDRRGSSSIVCYVILLHWSGINFILELRKITVGPICASERPDKVSVAASGSRG
jgi:hypothetical protein